MASTVRNVKDIEAAERQVYESVLGQKLLENQQVVIQVVASPDTSAPSGSGGHAPPSGKLELPKWCEVYEGLSDDEIAQVENVILCRRDMSRPSQ